MEFYEVLKKRRSIRSYKSDAVPEDSLKRIMEAVRMAPTACNRQPYKIFFVRNARKCAALAEVYPGSWLKTAPVIAVVAVDKSQAWVRREGDSIADVDGAIVMENFVLAAAAEGLGTCWVCAFERDAADEVLGLKGSRLHSFALSPLGYAAEGPSPFTRKDLTEIAEIVE